MSSHLHSEHGVGHGSLVEHGEQGVRRQVSSLGKRDPLGLNKRGNQDRQGGGETGRGREEAERCAGG